MKVLCRIRLLIFGIFALSAVITGWAASSDYKIQPEDLLHIVVFDEQMLSLQTRVHGSGNITYPLLKTVYVADHTAREVETKIRDLLAADYLVNPQVTINILEYRAQTYSVMGEVLRPTTYQLPPERSIDIVEAIAIAGGVTPNGRKRSIELYRKGKKSKHNLDDLLIQKNKDPEKVILIEHGDVIKVPTRFL